MDTAIRDHFANLAALAHLHLDEVKILEEDHTPQRSLFRLSAKYYHYRVFITEIVTRRVRKYRYYALDGERVVAGFDNAADPRALRLKYGQIGEKHIGELVPHLHLEDKTKLELTREIECVEFIVWLETHLSLTNDKERTV